MRGDFDPGGRDLSGRLRDHLLHIGNDRAPQGRPFDSPTVRSFSRKQLPSHSNYLLFHRFLSNLLNTSAGNLLPPMLPGLEAHSLPPQPARGPPSAEANQFPFSTKTDLNVPSSSVFLSSTSYVRCFCVICPRARALTYLFADWVSITSLCHNCGGRQSHPPSQVGNR